MPIGMSFTKYDLEFIGIECGKCITHFICGLANDNDHELQMLYQEWFPNTCSQQASPTNKMLLHIGISIHSPSLISLHAKTISDFIPLVMTSGEQRVKAVLGRNHFTCYKAFYDQKYLFWGILIESVIAKMGYVTKIKFFWRETKKCITLFLGVRAGF